MSHRDNGGKHPGEIRRPNYWLRIYVWERDHGQCVYCGVEAHDVDHVYPYSKGGKTEESNLVVSCSQCNQIARDLAFRSVDEKREFILNARKTQDHPPDTNGLKSPGEAVELEHALLNEDDDDAEGDDDRFSQG